jgi:hypothetical protein
MPVPSVTCPGCRTELRFKTAPPVGVTVATCPRCGGTVPISQQSTTATPAVEPVTPGIATLASGGSDSTGRDTTQVRPTGASTAPEFSFLAPPQQPDEIGRLGQYRVLAELGRGGMGVVFRAEDPQLRRFVALKVILPSFAANPVEKLRFLREARAGGRRTRSRCRYSPSRRGPRGSVTRHAAAEGAEPERGAKSEPARSSDRSGPHRARDGPGYIFSNVAFSPNGRLGGAAAKRGGIVFEIESATVLGTVELGDLYAPSVAFSTDEQVVFGSRRTVEVYRLGADGVPEKTRPGGYR